MATPEEVRRMVEMLLATRADEITPRSENTPFAPPILDPRANYSPRKGVVPGYYLFPEWALPPDLVEPYRDRRREDVPDPKKRKRTPDNIG